MLFEAIKMRVPVAATELAGAVEILDNGNCGLLAPVNNAKKAATNADVIFSDKVVSLNDKVNKAKKINDFKNFQINSKLMRIARKDAIFLHCLPRGSEVSDSVFFGRQSKVWQQALNRVHVQNSILLYCFGKLR